MFGVIFYNVIKNIRFMIIGTSKLCGKLSSTTNCSSVANGVLLQRTMQ